MMRIYRLILLVVLALILIRVNQVYQEVKPKKLEPIKYEHCIRNGLSDSECKIAKDFEIEGLKDEKLF